MKERIRKLRRTLDLTQQEFADKIGMKRNTIANYETGRNEPSASVISLICREFNVNEVWLRTGEGGDENMFLKPQKNDLVAKAAILLGEKDPIFEAFVETYSKLNQTNRAILLNFGMDFLNSLNNFTKND